jgi:TRAP-type C4-dicarboxylate transport system permease small subunit
MGRIPERDEHVGTTLDVGNTEEFIARDREVVGTLPVFFRVLDTVLTVVMVVLLSVLVVSVGANVFGRFVLDNSLAISDELARFLFVWVIFLGAALAHLHREHIAVDLLVAKLPASLQRAAAVVQELLVLVLMVALLVGAREVLATAPGKFPLLGLPYNWMNIAVPTSAVVMGLVTVYRIAVAVRPARPSAPQED